MSTRTIFLIVIAAGVLVGAVMGMLRSEFGGSALLWGGVAGFTVGVLASLLFQRRARRQRAASEC